MKSVNQIKPSYAPAYTAAAYPDLAKICIKHGYALAVHGSLQRDLDVIAIPWIDKASDPEEVIKDILSKYCLKQIDEITIKEHGRISYTLSWGFGECFVDFSFMPRIL